MKFKKQLKHIGVSIFLVASMLLTTSCGFVQEVVKNELSVEEIYEMVSPSVVEIKAISSEFSSTGTGFFYDDKGTVVTNYHVIKDCTSATITLPSGITYSVDKVLGYSKSRDIAILSTDCSVSVPLNIRTTEVHTGEPVYIIGTSSGLSGSLSDGLVSSVNRVVNGEKFIQTSAPASPGNSGGPLIDKNGDVIGIITISKSDGQNLNFAIPIADVNNISLNSGISLKKLFPSEDQEVEENIPPQTIQPTQHTCFESGCNIIVEGTGYYCTTHTCEGENCTSKKEENSKYCSHHITHCIGRGCSFEREYGTKFCSFHKCWYFGCTKKATTDNHCCEEHSDLYDNSCSYDGCPMKKVSGSEYCDFHKQYQ